MLKKGLTRDLLIFLANFADELGEVMAFRSRVRQAVFGGYYQSSSLAPSVSRLLSVGNIEKIQKGGKMFYRLTSQGWQKLKEDIPLEDFASRTWDGWWRLVIFDIAETNRRERNLLRGKLKELGFGRWQESVYLSPFAIEQETNQYLQAKKLFPHAVCLVAKHHQLGDDRELASAVWHLEELNEEYERFIADCQDSFGKGKINQTEYQTFWLQFRDLQLKDPFLPKELLPAEWKGEEAKEALRRLLKRLIKQ